MKSQEELQQLKTRLGDLDEKLAQLNEEELNQVIGGVLIPTASMPSKHEDIIMAKMKSTNIKKQC